MALSSTSRTRAPEAVVDMTRSSSTTRRRRRPQAASTRSTTEARLNGLMR